jgi:hypothetical protein
MRNVLLGCDTSRVARARRDEVSATQKAVKQKPRGKACQVRAICCTSSSSFLILLPVFFLINLSPFHATATVLCKTKCNILPAAGDLCQYFGEKPFVALATAEQVARSQGR